MNRRRRIVVMGSGGSAPAFTPSSISGLSLWLKANDAATVHATGGLVDTWDDKSGNGYNATSSTSARPTTGTRTINGKNAFDFDGTSDFMSLPAGVLSLPSGANTIFITFQADNTGDAQQELLAMLSGGGGFRYEVGFTTTNLVVQNRTTSTSPTSQADTRDTTVKTVGFRRSGTAITPFIDGVQGTPGSNSENLTAASAVIGAQNTSTNRLNGLLAEIILYNSSLSDSDMNRVGNYLNTEWGGGWTNI